MVTTRSERQGIGTASEDMWYDLTYLLVQLGIVPSTSISHNRSHELDGRIIKESICYTITVSGKQQLKLGIHVNPSRRSAPSYIERDERVLIPIRRISRLHYKGPIYTPETEDHTYLMPVVTHNCALWYPA